jgi:hypothetical protein
MSINKSNLFIFPQFLVQISALFFETWAGGSTYVYVNANNNPKCANSYKH